ALDAADELRAGAHVELAIRVAQVELYGLLAQEQLRGGLTVGRAPGRDQRDLELAVRQAEQRAVGRRHVLATGRAQLGPGALGRRRHALAVEVVERLHERRAGALGLPCLPAARAEREQGPSAFERHRAPEQLGGVRERRLEVVP